MDLTELSHTNVWVPGLIIGVADSLLLVLYRVSRPHVAVLGEIPGSCGQWADVAVHPEDQTRPGVSVLRVESGVFFANADHVRAVIDEAASGAGIAAVVLDCGTIPSLDVTAARMLTLKGATLPRQQARRSRETGVAGKLLGWSLRPPWGSY